MDDLMREDGETLFQEKRYAEAAEAFRHTLGQDQPAGREAETRRRLADTLDVLGQNAEAAEERVRADAVASSAPNDPQALVAWADLRKREGRYNDACGAYTQALSLMPATRPSLFFIEPLDDPARALVMAKLALAHHSGGRPDETIRWAEASLTAGAEPQTKLSMLRMAGVGSVDSGKLEQAERYYREALAWAEALGRPADIAHGLALMAGFERKRGRFEEAIAACRRAAQVAPLTGGLDLTIEAECLREMGRFDEARKVILRNREMSTTDKPWAERRRWAIQTLGLAWLEASAENPDAAWDALNKAREGLESEPQVGIWPPSPEDGRLILWCDATEAHIQAQKGRGSEARRLMESAWARLTAYHTDLATLKTVYAQTGRAALRLGDLVESRRLWQSYLDCRPFPAATPTIQFHLGETYFRSGDRDAAREAFQQAVAPGIDSLDARRAQARLDELGV